MPFSLYLLPSREILYISLSSRSYPKPGHVLKSSKLDFGTKMSNVESRGDDESQSDLKRIQTYIFTITFTNEFTKLMFSLSKTISPVSLLENSSLNLLLSRFFLFESKNVDIQSTLHATSIDTFAPAYSRSSIKVVRVDQTREGMRHTEQTYMKKE